MDKKKLVSLVTGTLLLSSVIGVGIANAKSMQAPTAQPVVTQSVQAQAPDNEVKGAVDKDNLQEQQGLQTQDTKGIDTEKSTEAKGEAKGIEADENLPGGGHADPDGADVNHDYQGIE